MTLPLPDPLVDQREWGEERTGVQRNFEALAQRFPLSASSENFQQVPQCRVYHSTTQAVAHNTVVPLVFNSEDYDLGTPSLNMHDTATNTGRLVCRVAGLYVCEANVDWAANTTTAVRNLFLRVDGTTRIGDDLRPVVNDGLGGLCRQSVVSPFRLAVDQYVEAVAYQNSGVSLNIVNGNFNPWFAMYWVSP